MDESEYQVQQTDFPNFKGVMLCARPEERQNIQREKDFCTRVRPKEKIGINPILRFKRLREKKQINHADKAHKRWLKNFQKEIQVDQEEALRDAFEERFRAVKFRERSTMIRRSMMKKKYTQSLLDNQHNQEKKQLIKRVNHPKNFIDYDQLIENVISEVDCLGRIKQSPPPPQKNKKTKRKPAWATTKENIDNEDLGEDNEILEFMDNHDIEAFIEDLEVKHIVKMIKKRVKEISRPQTSIPNHKKPPPLPLESEFIPNKNNYILPEESKPGYVWADSKPKRPTTAPIIKKTRKQRIPNRVEQDLPSWSNYNNGNDRSDKLLEKIAKNITKRLLANYPNYRNPHPRSTIFLTLQREIISMLQERGLHASKPPNLVTHLGPSRVHHVDAYQYRNPAI